MSEAWIIEPASPEDAVAIAALTDRSWRSAYRDILPDAVLDGLDPHSRATRWQERLAAPQDAHQVLVARAGGRIDGFAWFGASQDHPLHPGAVAVGELHALYLEPARFGSGLADALMDPAEAWLAPRFPRSILWVLEGNVRARCFYERRGWRHDGGRLPYPRPGCPGVRIVRHSWRAPWPVGAMGTV